MSGGISQLIAVGAQDAHLVGKPQVSFFQSMYKRHTNFSHVVERQVIQGNVSNNGMSTVRFERKGDLLSYVYLTPSETSTSQSSALTGAQFKTAISKVELLVGGQVIDEQTSDFSVDLAPNLFAQNLSRSVKGEHFDGSGTGRYFYPLRFSFCENWQSALPLVALQYHDVEIRITWGSSAANNKWECFANFVFLDTEEREMFASREHNYLVHQVQKSVAANAKVHELNFNHPIKFIASASNTGLVSDTNKIKLQINGTDIADFKFARPHFTQVASYYHAPYAAGNASDYFLYPFCLETSKLQPTGSLNFSRLDSARIICDSANSDADIYAVNYNVLKIQNGMGGLMYAN